MAKETIFGLRFEIRHPDGRAESLVADTDRAMIGSGAHCEIRVPSEHASVEHVVISLVGGAVCATARALDIPPTLNGVPFIEAVVLPESILGVGGIQIRVSAAQIADNPNIIKKKTQKTNPIVYLLGLFMVPLAGFIFAYEDTPEFVLNTPADVTPLWNEPGSQCKVRDPSEALNFAALQQVSAEAKRERHPFHVQDGVVAVPLFEMASACYAAGGAADAAAEAQAAARGLRAKIDAQYRAHQVKLEHSLVVGDYGTAAREVKMLRAMTEGKRGAYVLWLSDMERRLSLMAAEHEAT